MKRDSLSLPGTSSPTNPTGRAVPTAEPRAPSVDVVVAPGVSIHLYGNRVGIFSNRIEAGRGFVEMPLRDLLAVMRYLGDTTGSGDQAQGTNANAPDPGRG